MFKRLELGRVRFAAESFQRQIEAARQTIDDAFRMIRNPRPCVAFSGGKDSIATAALVHSVCDDVCLCWSDDELEFPETLELMDFLRRGAPELFRAYRGSSQHAGWFTPWIDAPFFREPLPGTRAACADSYRHAVAADGFNLTFLGTTMAESHHRRNWLLTAGPNYRCKGGDVRSCPIASWTADDVWALIAGWRLGYNRAYERFERMRLDDRKWRVGPLPLVPRRTLEEGWPDLLARLEARYDRRWR